MDTHHLAWAAGILDGEGSIILHRRTGRHRHFQLLVSVGNTDPKMVIALKALFGGAIHYDTSRTRLGSKPIWRWHSVCRGAETVLRSVRPWLVTKADQADVALLSRSLIGRRGVPITDDIFEQQRWLCRRLSELKWGEARVEKEG